MRFAGINGKPTCFEVRRRQRYSVRIRKKTKCSPN